MIYEMLIMKKIENRKNKTCYISKFLYKEKNQTSTKKTNFHENLFKLKQFNLFMSNYLKFSVFLRYLEHTTRQQYHGVE
jgi:hypothetical protein